MPLDNTQNDNHFSAHIKGGENVLEKLLLEVQDRRAKKEDYIAPTSGLRHITSEGGSSRVVAEGSHGSPTTILAVNPVASNQIAQKAGLDVRTADRVRSEYPQQYDGLIQAIWEKEDKPVMLRTFSDGGSSFDETGTLRAVLSDKYKTFDNEDLAEATIRPILDSPAKWEAVRASITDQKLSLQFKSLAITGEGAGVGDLMAHGLGVSNSETGHGSVSVYQIAWTLACLNGMQTQNKSRSAHLTSSRSDGDTWSLLTDKSKDLDNQALKSKLTDITKAYTSEETFLDTLEKFKQAGQNELGAGVTPQMAVDRLSGILKLSKNDNASVLDGLVATVSQAGYAGRPVTQATLANAVTAVQHTSSLDSVDDWQALGSKVLDLPANQWRAVANPVAVAV